MSSGKIATQMEGAHQPLERLWLHVLEAEEPQEIRTAAPEENQSVLAGVGRALVKTPLLAGNKNPTQTGFRINKCVTKIWSKDLLNLWIRAQSLPGSLCLDSSPPFSLCVDFTLFKFYTRASFM